MRRFVTALYQSLYNANWLKAQRFAPGPAWRYFALFVLFIALVGWVPVVANVPRVVQTAVQTMGATVPDFTATMHAGKLRISMVPQPFQYRDAAKGFLAYIDTMTTSTLAAKDFATGTIDTVAVLTATNIQLYNADDDSVQTLPFGQAQDGSLTKAELFATIQKFQSPGAIALFDGLLIVALYAGLFVSKLYMVCLVSIFALLVGRLRGLAWRFREYFTIGLYAVTLPTAIGFVASVIGLQIVYLQFISMLAFMIALVWSNEEGTSGRVV